MNKTSAFLLAIAFTALTTNFAAAAQTSGAFGLGGHITYTMLDDSDKLPNVGGNAKAKSAVGGNLMGHLSLGDEGFLRHFATELAVDFSRHDVTAEKTIYPGVLKAGKVRLLTASWSLLWMIMPEWNFCPYLGAGVSYVNLKSSHSGDLDTIKYKSRAGGLVQAGLKFYPSDLWSIDLDVKKIGFRSKSKPRARFTKNGVPGEVDWSINPLIVGLGATYYFE